MLRFLFFTKKDRIYALAWLALALSTAMGAPTCNRMIVSSDCTAEAFPRLIANGTEASCSALIPSGVLVVCDCVRGKMPLSCGREPRNANYTCAHMCESTPSLDFAKAAHCLPEHRSYCPFAITVGELNSCLQWFTALLNKGCQWQVAKGTVWSANVPSSICHLDWRRLCSASPPHLTRKCMVEKRSYIQSPECRTLVSGAELFTPPALNLIHIPKTGGSSLEKLAADMPTQIGWSQVFDARNSWGELEPDLSAPCRVCEEQRNCCNWWHLPPRWLKRGNHRGYFETDTFCVVRNPMTRIVSEWRFQTGAEHALAIRRNQGAMPPFFDAGTCPTLLNEGILAGLRKFRSASWPIATHQIISISPPRCRKNQCYQDCHWLRQVDYVVDESGKRDCDHVLALDDNRGRGGRDGIIGLTDLIVRFGLHDRLPLLTASLRSEELLVGHPCGCVTTFDLNATVRERIQQVYAADFRLIEALNYSQILQPLQKHQSKSYCISDAEVAANGGYRPSY